MAGRSSLAKSSTSSSEYRLVIVGDADGINLQVPNSERGLRLPPSTHRFARPMRAFFDRQYAVLSARRRREVDKQRKDGAP